MEAYVAPTLSISITNCPALKRLKRRVNRLALDATHNTMPYIGVTDNWRRAAPILLLRHHSRSTTAL